MTQQAIDLHTNPSDEAIRLGPLTVRFLITGENSNGSIAAFEVLVPCGQRLAAPAHSHDHYEETIYGIDGVLTWTVDGKPIDVGPGQTLCIPRGAVHRFDNNGIQDAKALCVVTPAEIGPQYFRECAEVIGAAAGGPPDRAKLAGIMRRHRLTPAPVLALLFALALAPVVRSAPQPQNRNAQLARGEYLANQTSLCGDCHTEHDAKGMPIKAKNLQGAKITLKPNEPLPASIWAGIAPPIAGLTFLTNAEAVVFFTTGKMPDGKPARAPMPGYRFSRADAEALVAYLKSLPGASK